MTTWHEAQATIAELRAQLLDRDAALKHLRSRLDVEQRARARAEASRELAWRTMARR